MQVLVSRIRDLAADKLLDSGFANPTIEATAVSEDGKRVKKQSSMELELSWQRVDSFSRLAM